MALVVGTGAARARGHSSWASPLLLVAGIALGALAGHAAAGVPWRQAATQLAAQGWPAAEAKIGSVGLAEVAEPGGARGLALTVTYAYEVGGEIYEGTRAGPFDRGGLDDRRLKALYARLNFARVTGATVPVFHHPDEPAIAVLDRAVPWRPVLTGAGTALALLVAGLGCVTAVFRRPR